MATAAAPNNAAREARRRRIIERGSDRLALISGRIQSLQPDTDRDQSRPSTCSPAQIPAADSSQNQDTLLLPTEESVEQHEQHSISSETSNRNIPSRSVTLHEESSQIPSSTAQRPATEPHQREQTHRSLFTSGQIRSAVAASENTRMSCSVAAAVLVIASYMGLPILGIQGTIAFRPVFLLLLTNMTIVLGRVILGGRGIESKTGRRSGAPPTAGGNDLADQLGRALELGLLMQKILGAVSMDFSIYAVVLVSGLSIVGRLGW